jgi:hypothetical protein
LASLQFAHSQSFPTLNAADAAGPIEISSCRHQKSLAKDYNIDGQCGSGAIGEIPQDTAVRWDGQPFNIFWLIVWVTAARFRLDSSGRPFNIDEYLCMIMDKYA